MSEKINEANDVVKKEVVVNKESELVGEQAKVTMEINVDDEKIGSLTIEVKNIAAIDRMLEIFEQTELIFDGLHDLAVVYLLSGEFDDELSSKEMTKDDLQEMREMMNYNEKD